MQRLLLQVLAHIISYYFTRIFLKCPSYNKFRSSRFNNQGTIVTLPQTRSYFSFQATKPSLSRQMKKKQLADLPIKQQFGHFCCTFLANIPCKVWILEDRQPEWQTMAWEERHKHTVMFIALAFSYKRYFPGRGGRMACLKMVWTFTTSLRWLCLDKWKEEILYFYEEEIKRRA